MYTCEVDIVKALQWNIHQKYKRVVSSSTPTYLGVLARIEEKFCACRFVKHIGQ